MGKCRACHAKIKAHQIYCPKCGAEHPLLDKDDVKHFSKLKKRFILLFSLIILVLASALLLFLIKIPAASTEPYTVKQTIPKPVTTSLPPDCVDVDYEYKLVYYKPQVFAKVLSLEYNIRNLESLGGEFEYAVSAVDKISLEEKTHSKKLLLGPYENVTSKAYFKDINLPRDVDIYFSIKPPKKTVCKEYTETSYSTQEEEETRLKEEKYYKTLFEFLLDEIKGGL